MTRHAGTAGLSRERRPIRYEVLGHGSETVLVVASMHGDEGAGTPLLHALGAAMMETPAQLDGRTLVLVPVANPDGLARDRRPTRIISIHQPLACIDYDGPAERLARAVAGAGDLPVRKLGARPGSLGAWAGEDRGVPVLMIELPGDASDLDSVALWARYGEMMKTAIGTDAHSRAGVSAAARGSGN